MLDMTQEVSIVHDLESNGLLTAETVDYTASPWKLKDTFKMHVIAVLEEETNQLIAFYDGDTINLDGRTHEVDVGGYKVVLEGYTALEYLHFPLHKFPDYVKKRKIKKATGQNVINFDLLVYKVVFGLDYTIGEEGDTWAGKPVYHNDTLVKSKTLNPDRFEHNLDYLSRQAGGAKKVDFRPNVPKELKFEVFGADMLYYNLFDLLSTQSVDKYLDKEAGTHPWAGPIQLEKCVMNLITQQSHRGFAFNLELAEKCVKELDMFMTERKQRVEPLLPKKKATKTFMKDFTPPKSQFKKDGSLSAHMEKFIQKIGATVKDNDTIVFEEKEFKLPLEDGESLVKEVAASIDDTTHIKEWLVSLGWVPSEWKEKDLTVNTKKQKLSESEYAAAVERYVDQTLNSPFCAERCEYLECSPRTLRTFLLGKNIKRPVRVQTNPNFTKGTDKEMCPDLERISEQFPFAKDVIEYLTFKHRRNSILGGGLDWEDEGDAEKGFMSQVREDGRIPTPADTCGAATSRMKHKGVCNIARVTSLYGKEMRSLFRADPEMCYQIGYDFASLEAVIESHYCNKYEKPTIDGVRAYCESLLQEKPNDVHTKTAEFISSMLGKEFSRGNAKGVKYGCTYGAQAAKVAKTIGSSLLEGEMVFDAFWKAALPLAKLKEALQKHWEKNDKKYIVTIDGRKVPTRAAHAILNSLFQSAGVICAKRSMVRWETLMRREGLWVDFWKEDWKSSSFAMQMIAYHDEAQIEVTKDLVKFKRFATKEECKEFRKQQKEGCGMIWSEEHESPKGGWFVAYSKPGELVVQAVNETTEFYKLCVPLSADYVLGTGWHDCH